MSRITHMCLNVRGFLRNARFPKAYLGMFKHDDGRPMTPEEARDTLFDEIKQGHEVIPFGPCDNFDYAGRGCLGHDAPDHKEETHG